jgi:hypothetical protein
VPFQCHVTRHGDQHQRNGSCNDNGNSSNEQQRWRHQHQHQHQHHWQYQRRAGGREQREQRAGMSRIFIYLFLVHARTLVVRVFFCLHSSPKPTYDYSYMRFDDFFLYLLETHVLYVRVFHFILFSIAAVRMLAFIRL